MNNMLSGYCRKLSVVLLLILPAAAFSQSKDVLANNLLLQKNNAKETLKAEEKAYSEAQKTGNKAEEAEVLFQMGKNWNILLEYDKASECYYKAQKIFEELKDTKKIARNFMCIGEVYRAIAEYKPAFEYLHKARRIFEAENYEPGLAKTYDRLASVYYENVLSNPGLIDSILYFANKAISISKKIKADDVTSSSLNIIGSINTYLKNYDKALSSLKEALDFAISKNIENDIPLIKFHIANAYYFKKDYDMAIKYGLETYDYATKTATLPYIDMSTYLLYLTYSEKKDYKNASKYLLIYTNNRWVLYDIKKNQLISTLQIKYETEKKEADLLSREKTDKLRVVIFVAVLLIACGVIAAYMYRNKVMQKKNTELESSHAIISQQNEKLKELNTTKDKLFSIIGHDLKNPYQSLKGFSSILLQDYKELSEDEIKEFLGYIYEASDSGNRLLQNLLDWSRSETGNIKYEPENFFLHEIIEESVNLTSNNALQKEISIEAKISNSLEVYCDRNMIYTVLRNLLSNAIKFSNRGGKICISSAVNGPNVQIKIADNGVGMTEDLIKDLFKLETRVTKDGTDGEKGTGLGLYLCKEFIEKNKGTVWVESTPGVGSTFFFTLPPKNI